MIGIQNMLSLIEGLNELKVEALAGNMTEKDINNARAILEGYTDWSVAYAIADWLKPFIAEGNERNAKEAKDASQEF